MVQGFIRDNLWQSVYLIEFYKKDILTDSFAFGVPPESEEFVLSQRKSETKTFGGLVIDDYGCDALKITLSGTSVNNEFRRIYHSFGSSEMLTGEEEIFRLKALIEKYKGDNSTLGDKILLYDLSKHRNKKRKSKMIDSFCWEVFPGELKIKRSKDRPNVYTYSIDFTGIKNEPSVLKRSFFSDVDFTEAFKKVDEFLDNMQSEIKEKMSFISDGINSINELRGIVNESKELVALAVGGTINNVVELASNINRLGLTALDFYKETVGDVASVIFRPADFVAASFIDLLGEVSVFYKNLMETIKPDFYKSIDDFEDWRLLGMQAKELFTITTNNLYKDLSNMSVSAQHEREFKVPLPTKDGDILYSYGMNARLLKEGESFESIARDEYGDVNKSVVLAVVNGESSIDELKSKGQRYMLVPILEKKDSNYDNPIIGLSGQRDIFGIDIKLDDKGNLILNEDKTDFTLVKGKNNLSQAILMRLKENMNKRVMQQYYGIKTNVPEGESVGSAYILSSIVQTLSQEPRIKEILSISFFGKADVLNIEIDYKDLSGEELKVKGVI